MRAPSPAVRLGQDVRFPRGELVLLRKFDVRADDRLLVEGDVDPVFVDVALVPVVGGGGYVGGPLSQAECVTCTAVGKGHEPGHPRPGGVGILVGGHAEEGFRGGGLAPSSASVAHRKHDGGEAAEGGADCHGAPLVPAAVRLGERIQPMPHLTIRDEAASLTFTSWRRHLFITIVRRLGKSHPISQACRACRVGDEVDKGQS
mmetsp:Transcript_38692/g.116227  ORF Transcript_38692/g.116227 Transcript_38692/m.116227 type:complete len:203 (+) Transcript_38692:874-1482(+)